MLIEKYIFRSGEILEIHQDEDAENPRTGWDNLGTMVCSHPRYSLGDQDHGLGEASEIRPDDFAVCLPLYLYDHSGITMSTRDFGDRWDSGQVGWIVLSAEDLKKEYGETNDESIANATAALEGEVKVYDQLLRGDVFGFILKDASGEDKDSCWGFYGDDIETNGIVDHLPEELRREVLEKTYRQESAS